MLKTFITRPVFTAMLMLALVVFGINAYPRIGVDQFPDVEFPVVTVTTVLPGADPESMEKNVSDPLEEALNTLNGVEQLRSINLESVSQIVVRFTLDTKVDVASQDVRDRVQATLSKLPAEIETKVKDLDGVTDVKIELVWDPPWDPSKMSEAARLQLGMM